MGICSVISLKSTPGSGSFMLHQSTFTIVDMDEVPQDGSIITCQHNVKLS